ncbi:UNVERIFIED_CONTAM: chorismate synthase, partial [Bacillus amyloliquefaciens DSM 7 = ATCC 23350]
AKITRGVRHARTLGSPIALDVENKDWTHRTKIMGAAPTTEEEESEMKRQISRPRPGHADLNGAIKYKHPEMRKVLERASARETT